MNDSVLDTRHMARPSKGTEFGIIFLGGDVGLRLIIRIPGVKVCFRILEGEGSAD